MSLDIKVCGEENVVLTSTEKRFYING